MQSCLYINLDPRLPSSEGSAAAASPEGPLVIAQSPRGPRQGGWLGLSSASPSPQPMSNFGLEPWPVGLGSTPASWHPGASLQPCETGEPHERWVPLSFPDFSLLHQNLLKQMCTWDQALQFQGSLPKICEVTFASVYLLFGAWGQGRNVQIPMTPRKPAEGVTMGVGPADLWHSRDPGQEAQVHSIFLAPLYS